jgi:sulfhydrogenase subunit beta (sulfur reductase)
MKYVTIPHGSLPDFVTHLARQQKVVAPVAKGNDNYAFEPVTSGREVALRYIPTILPPKKYFMPQHETLLEYDCRQGQHMQAVVEHEEMILFGVHTCDLAGIECLNTVFADRPKDLNYLIRKSRITIVGLECNDYCDDYASCGLMNTELPSGGYDLFLTDLGDRYIGHVHTYVGDTLAASSGLFRDATGADLEALEGLRHRKRGVFRDEVAIDLTDIPRLFDHSLKTGIWKGLGERCLACGNCTNVCPTCYCFDIVDEPDLDMQTGRRVRVWDSCQNERFAKVAGGESFRKERSSRKKHRFFRKFRYPVDRFGKFFCTGCGRCSRTCMARINLKETLAQLVKEYV